MGKIVDEMVDLENQQNEYQEPESWTIMSAMERVLNVSEEIGLCNDLWELCKNPLDFLSKTLNISAMQAVILTTLVEENDPITWKTLSGQLQCSRITMMNYNKDMDDLVERRWVVRTKKRAMGNECTSYMVVHAAIDAFCENKVYEPEKIEGLTTKEFVERLEYEIEKMESDFPPDRNMTECEDWLEILCKANKHLPLCQVALDFGDIHVMSMLLYAIADYSCFASDENEGLHRRDITNVYPYNIAKAIINSLLNGSFPLVKDGWLEPKCNEGTADLNAFCITRKCKEELLAGCEPSYSQTNRVKKSDAYLKKYSGIVEKPMFYNDEDKEQIDMITNLLSQENFTSVQQRLEEEGMRKGFACLFYGGPGTGKTETVLQLARRTGRDIMQIDIAGIRDKYVGESEKNIKAAFARYKSACKKCDVMPILLFNEADGILGKRTNAGLNPTVEKEENAIQNIILEEMENLEGILIATTNLSKNLDRAFERRFLFKVKFHNPETNVKAKLFKSMLDKDLTDDEAMRLAKKYDLSGGQIENVKRKCTIKYILNGARANYDEIDTLCHDESMSKSTPRRAVGFN